MARIASMCERGGQRPHRMMQAEGTDRPKGTAGRRPNASVPEAANLQSILPSKPSCARKHAGSVR